MSTCVGQDQSHLKIVDIGYCYLDQFFPERCNGNLLTALVSLLLLPYLVLHVVLDMRLLKN